MTGLAAGGGHDQLRGGRRCVDGDRDVKGGVQIVAGNLEQVVARYVQREVVEGRHSINQQSVGRRGRRGAAEGAAGTTGLQAHRHVLGVIGDDVSIVVLDFGDEAERLIELDGIRRGRSGDVHDLGRPGVDLDRGRCGRERAALEFEGVACRPCRE